MTKNLVNRYVDDLPADPTGIYYVKSFIKNFRNISEEWIEDTVWHGLWLDRGKYTDNQLAFKIMNTTTLLNSRNGMYAKHTNAPKNNNNDGDETLDVANF